MSLRETFEVAWQEVTSHAHCVVQEKEELFALAALMHAEGVKSYLELGASEGVSLCILGRCLPHGSQVRAVDLGEKHSVGHLGMNIIYLNSIKRHADMLILSTKDYHIKHLNDFEGPKVWDAILIDAGHTYEEVRRDWEMFGNLGRMIIFHDIRHDGVNRLWNEIKSQHRTVEIHAGKYTVYGGDKMGFGVVFQ